MSLPTFVSAEPFARGQTVTLGEDDARHIKVRRLELGTRVALVDGQGMRGEGALVRLAKRHAAVTIDATSMETPPPPIHLILPVADRDRMLWIAEKAAELALTSWRPVTFRRSRSVSPRGEGPVFTQKVAARMAAALEQSGGAWLPTIYPAAKLDRAIASTPAGARIVMDAGGAPLEKVLSDVDARGAAVTIAIGPEGGLEPDELRELTAGGFREARLGGTILRFETAAIGAMAVARASLDARRPSAATRSASIGGEDD